MSNVEEPPHKKRKEEPATQKLIDLLLEAILSNSGGNIVLLWDIWCAEISLERRQGGEIWGNIEWPNAVMTVDPFLDRCKAVSSI